MGRLEALLQGPLRMGRGLRSAGDAHSLVVGSVAVTLAQLSVGGLYALTSLYLVRTLPTEQYGRAAFGIYIYTLLQAVAGLGLGTGVLAEVARGRTSEGVAWPTVHALLWVRLFSIVPVLLVGFGWAALSGNVLPAMASVIAAPAIVADFLIGVLAGGLRTRAYVLVTLCQPASFLALLLLLRASTAESALIALGSALALSVLLAVAFLGRRGSSRIGRPRVSLSELGHAVGVARNAYLIGTLNIGFTSIPIILLGALGRYAEAAALSIVLTLVRFAPEALGLAVVSTYFPRLKAAEPRGPAAAALFGTFARLLAVLAIPATAGLAVLGRPLLAVLFGGRYDQLAPYLTVGSVLVVLLAAESLLIWTLVARNEGSIAIVAVALRLGVILAASIGTVALGLSNDDSLVVLLIAAGAGVLSSVIIQALRTRRTFSLPWPTGAFAVYALVAVGAYLAIGTFLAGVPDLGIVVVTGLLTLPLMAFGAFLIRPRQVPAGGGTS
jgi:O-antigen/teichoic acid export membrane protein